MKPTVIILFAAALILCSTSAVCDSPEDTIKAMMEAVKAKDYEKAASFIDIEGIVAQMRAQMAKMMEGVEDEAVRKQIEEQLGSVTVEKMKEEMVKAMKSDPPEEFTYKIIETKDGPGGTKIVVVEIKEGDEEPETQELPMKKVGGVWKVSFPEEAMAGDDDDDDWEEMEEGEDEEGK